MATQCAPSVQANEESLIQAGQRGDAQALDTLFHRHQRTLFRSALGIMGNAHDAEDALQDGLLSAFRNLKSFKGRSQFSTWLTRVVINAALMRHRGQAVRPSPAGAEPVSKDEIPITERLVSKGLNPEQLFGHLEIRKILRDPWMSLRRNSAQRSSCESGGIQHQGDRRDIEGVRRDFKSEAVAGAARTCQTHESKSSAGRARACRSRI